MFESVRTVVLNATYEPVSIISSKKALIRVFEGKATVLEEHPEIVIHSVNRVWGVPTQIVLKKYVKVRATFRVPAQLTQRNLFVRDKYTCQYCNTHKKDLKSGAFLTRDHIIPTARGGKDVWENVVTACSSCNNKKADSHLTDTNMRLSRMPHTPTIFEIWSKATAKYIRPSASA